MARNARNYTREEHAVLAEMIRGLISDEPNEDGKHFYLRDLRNDEGVATHLSEVMGRSVHKSTVGNIRHYTLSFTRDNFYARQTRAKRQPDPQQEATLASVVALLGELEKAMHVLTTRVERLEQSGESQYVIPYVAGGSRQ